MKRTYTIALMLVGLAGAMAPCRGQSVSTDTPNLSGVWALNRDRSDNPQHAGFVEASLFRGGGAPIGGGFGGGLDGPTDPKDVQRRIEELTNEARNPSPLLTIKQAAAEITIMDFQGRMHTFHATGKKETLQLRSGTVDSTTRWDGTRLVTEYNVASDRKLSYTYTLVPGEKPQLLVLVKFDGRGISPVTSQVYDGSVTLTR